MAQHTDDTVDLAREIERLRGAQPHLGTLLDAFGPLMIERHRWLSETDINPRALPIDPQRYAAGIPLNRQQLLFCADDPWGSGGWSAAKAIAEGFPHLGRDMEVLLGRLVAGEYQRLFPFFAGPLEGDEEIDLEAAELGISPASLKLYLRAVYRFMLAKRAREPKTELGANLWHKGYCPVCGSFPHLAILGDKGRRRLHCIDCGHAWPFGRLTCPYCDHENPQDTNMLFIEGKKEESVFACDQCRRYLLTASRAGGLGPTSVDLISISLVHLDIIAQEKGYSPMAGTDWNSLPVSEG